MTYNQSQELTMTLTMDICDRCCAASAVTVMMPSLNQLNFCQHHYNEYADTLDAQGASLISDAELAEKLAKITPEPAPA